MDEGSDVGDASDPTSMEVSTDSSEELASDYNVVRSGISKDERKGRVILLMLFKLLFVHCVCESCTSEF